MNSIITESREKLPGLIADELITAGISPVRLGYTYLLRAVAEIIADSSLMVGITKTLYPRLADCYGTSPHAVERNIRTAIKSACKYENRNLKKFMDCTSGCKVNISNKEFIFKTVNRVKKRLEISNNDEY